MKKYSFKIGGTCVSVENDFIPSGEDYTELTRILANKLENSGYFKMQFSPSINCINANLLTVTYKK